MVDTADMVVATEISTEITTRPVTASLKPPAMVHFKAHRREPSRLQVATPEPRTHMLLVSRSHLFFIKPSSSFPFEPSTSTSSLYAFRSAYALLSTSAQLLCISQT